MYLNSLSHQCMAASLSPSSSELLLSRPFHLPQHALQRQCPLSKCSRRQSRCTKLGVGFSGGSQFEGSLMPCSCCHIHATSSHIGPVIANLGLQSCFHELGATPSQGSAGLERFLWEILGDLGDFCGGEGCFWCR